jgi:hypothetical protein
MNDFKDRLRIRPLRERTKIDPMKVMDALLKRIDSIDDLRRIREKVSQALRIAEKGEREKKREAHIREKEALIGGIENREITEADWRTLSEGIEKSIAALPQQNLKSLNRKRERLQGLLNVCNHCRAHENRISFPQLRAFGFNSPNECHTYLQAQVTPNFCFRAQLKTSRGGSPDQFYFFTKIVPKTA